MRRFDFSIKSIDFFLSFIAKQTSPPSVVTKRTVSFRFALKTPLCPIQTTRDDGLATMCLSTDTLASCCLAPRCTTNPAFGPIRFRMNRSCLPYVRQSVRICFRSLGTTRSSSTTDRFVSICPDCEPNFFKLLLFRLIDSN